MKFTFLFLLNFSFLIVSAQIQIGNTIYGENLVAQTGQTVSLSSDGTRVAISSILKSIKIFDEKDGKWLQVGEDIEESLHQSNYSMALSSSGKRVVIGNKSEQVKIFEERDGEWTQIGGTIEGEPEIDRTGWSVALSSDGTRVALSSIFFDGIGINSGQVRIFEENGGDWIQIGDYIDGEAPEDKSGTALSLSLEGTRIAIGSTKNDNDNGEDAGHVRIFEENEGNWRQIGSDIDGKRSESLSGSSISMSLDGTRVVVGADMGSSHSYRSGDVRIYEEREKEWLLIGDIRKEERFARMGRSVSLSSDGKRVAFSFMGYVNGRSFGQVEIYEDYDAVWTRISKTIIGEELSDNMGASISLSADGNRLAIGAPNNEENGYDTGQVRVFDHLKVVDTEDLSPAENIQIFPNPSSKYINIEILNPSRKVMTIQIVDNLGRVIWKGGIIEAQSLWTQEIEIEASGIYFLIARIEDEILTQKIVITGEK